MITLAIFTSNNSIATFVATIESFFDKCRNRKLISEIIHIDDRSTIENIGFYNNVIKNVFKGIPIFNLHKKENLDFTHSRNCEYFRQEIIKSKNKNVFILEDDWFFIRNFDLEYLNNSLNSCNSTQISLTINTNPIIPGNHINLRMSNIPGFYQNDSEVLYTISERYEINQYVWNEVFRYNYFSLNPSLNKIDFFIKNGEFDIAADFEIKYNLRDLKKSFSTNLLSDEPYAVHIGKYKKLL